MFIPQFFQTLDHSKFDIGIIFTKGDINKNIITSNIKMFYYIKYKKKNM
jgi:hypothetical protein